MEEKCYKEFLKMFENHLTLLLNTAPIYKSHYNPQPESDTDFMAGVRKGLSLSLEAFQVCKADLRSENMKNILDEAFAESPQSTEDKIEVQN